MGLPLIEYLFRRELRGKTVVVLVMLLALIGGTLGCVRGLQPVGWSGVVKSDGTLFVGSKEGKLVAVDLTTGRRQWSEALKASQSSGIGCASPAIGGGCGAPPAGVAIYGTPAVADGLVCIGGYNGRIYAFTADGLAVRWVYPREGYLKPIVGGLMAMQGRVYFGTTDGRVLALDAATGDKQWEFQCGDQVWATPTGDGDTVYITSFDHRLYALSAEDGSQRWEFEVGGSIASAPLVYEGKLYIGSLDRHLYAVDAATGRELWRFMGGNWFWAEPVGAKGVIYAPCLDGKVYILDADNGDQVAAAVDLGSPVSASPVLVGDQVIIASQGGGVYALDTDSRQKDRLTSIKAGVYSPLYVSEGIVYIHTQDLTIHRVDVSQPDVELDSISLKEPQPEGE